MIKNLSYLKFEEYQIILLNSINTELIRKLIKGKRKELKIPSFLKLVYRENSSSKNQIILFKKTNTNFEEKLILNKVLQILIDNLIFDFELKTKSILVSNLKNKKNSNFWPRLQIKFFSEFVEIKKNLCLNLKEINKIKNNFLLSKNYYFFDRESLKTIFRGKKIKFSFLKNLLNYKKNINILFFSFQKINRIELEKILNLGISKILCPSIL